MEKKLLEKIIDRYLSGGATEEEKAFIEQWIQQAEEVNNPYSDDDLQQITSEIKGNILVLLNENDKVVLARKSTIRKLIVSTISIAASLLLFCSIGFYFFHNSQLQQSSNVKKVKNDVMPGGNKAILTLANGNKIVLTSVKNGIITRQGNTLINKVTDGKVTYASSNKDETEKNDSYNTISTPRGGKYDIMLPDGTNVTLDAQSSIRFPTAFSGNYRDVNTTGQVYFEVTHDPTKPFRVSTRGQIVEVLGTHFNINAYEDDNLIKTTLLEGSIKITKGSVEKIIMPGQQAITAEQENKIRLLTNVNMEPVTAWKDGFFRFDNDDLPTIMRQFSRWYDIDVIYEDKIAEHEFVGKITRNSKLSKVLKILSLGGVNFKIDGKKLIVRSK